MTHYLTLRLACGGRGSDLLHWFVGGGPSVTVGAFEARLVSCRAILGVMAMWLRVIRVDVSNDWLDYVTAVVGVLTAFAALWGLWLARQDAKRANKAVVEANREIANLRGVMEPADRLIRTRAQHEMVERLIDQNPRRVELEVDDPEYLTSPTAYSRYLEMAQRELVFLPDDALPLLRMVVDSADSHSGRGVTRNLEGPMPSDDEVLAEQQAYLVHLTSTIQRLEQDPQASGGLYKSM